MAAPTKPAADNPDDATTRDDSGYSDASALQRSLSISTGRCASDARPKPRTLTLAELIDEFSVPETTRGTLTSAQYHALDKNDPIQKTRRDREKDGEYFVPLQFAGDGRRCNDNVQALCGIALDFDSGNTTEVQIRRALNTFTYVAYTSFSHRAHDQRWRVFVPYEVPVERALHQRAYRHMQGLFDGDIDPRCETASQLWYTPACPPDAAADFRAFHAIGKFFDPRTLLATDDLQAKALAAADVLGGSECGLLKARVEDALRYIASDDRSIWVNFGIAIKHDLGDAGLKVWLEWSSRSAKFELEAGLEAWESFKCETAGPKITLGSIFYMARERGWTDDGVSLEIPTHVARLNEEYFLAPMGGRTLIFKEGQDPIDRRQTLQAMKIADFKALFTSDLVYVMGASGKRKRISSADAWLTHPGHRQFEGVVLAPNKDLRGYYNLWRGFAVEPRAGSWKLMRDHIRAILCNSDAEAFEWVLNWLARAVQQPDCPGEVALVLCGGRGAGKGMFARAVASLFGQHARQISQARHLTGNFNAHLAECVLLFVDEAFWAGDKQGESVLKSIITEPTLAIEKKGLDVVMVPNMLHVIMASNNTWVVPAGLDERRFLVLAVSDSMKQDVAYFSAIDQELRTGGLEAMLDELLNRDISDFNYRNAPKTRALIDQKLLSLDPIQQWFFERLQHGTLTGFMNDWELVRTSRVQEHYINCMKDVSSGRRALETELGMRLRKLLPPGFPVTVKASSLVHNVPVVAPHYRLPPLDVCRNYFADLLGLEGFDWGVEGTVI